MKFTLATIAAAMFFAPIAQADTIKCTFTEPFVTTTYKTSDRTLKIQGSDMKTKVLRNVELRMASGAIIQLVRNGKVLQALDLKTNGSDGMSDAIYPIEVKDLTLLEADRFGFATAGIGGCETDQMKKGQP